ncbi:cyclin [Striga asiatica]|uniref:Cyclin n=1 Tax=Striga asiatica TaxID=4170 RepID=A0A5A7P4F6_STRAF|nr:cyclin [Striga asiatica]
MSKSAITGGHVRAQSLRIPDIIPVFFGSLEESRPVREDPKHKDYASRLQDEMEKVDAFKRELDMCLILLRNDIGAEDVNNDMTVVKYVGDMYKFYKSAEKEGLAHNYIDTQSAINEKIHRIMISWLVPTHNKFELSLETFDLTD